MKTPAVALILSLTIRAAGAAQQAPAGAPPDSADQRGAAVAEMAMGGPMTMDLHMELTAPRPPAPGDSERAAAVVSAIRRSLGKYRDVGVALRDGFRPFLPRVQQQRIYHFTSWINALGERARFDPTRPTSLLYRKDPTGTLVLVGAMYTDAADTPPEELDRRIPLSIAHWHRHVNLCLPPRSSPGRWGETNDGQPVFGPHSPIATRAGCDAVGGRFVPRLFGWMVHVDAFAGDDAAIWDDAAHTH
jgi:hypothetical protein